jgi:predicted CoA-binding protein
MKEIRSKNKSQIEEFMILKSFAIVGVSAKKKKFGNEIFQQMIKRSFKIYPVHKSAGIIDGEVCYPDLQSLPEKPEGVILVIPPIETIKVVREIAELGIKHVWMQQGAVSNAAICHCSIHGIKVVSGECVLMFLENMGFPHNLHKWFRGLHA